MRVLQLQVQSIYIIHFDFKIYLDLDLRLWDDKSSLRKFVPDGARTQDHQVRSPTLYELSYITLCLVYIAETWGKCLCKPQ